MSRMLSPANTRKAFRCCGAHSAGSASITASTGSTTIHARRRRAALCHVDADATCGVSTMYSVISIPPACPRPDKGSVVGLIGDKQTLARQRSQDVLSRLHGTMVAVSIHSNSGM